MAWFDRMWDRVRTSFDNIRRDEAEEENEIEVVAEEDEAVVVEEPDSVVTTPEGPPRLVSIGILAKQNAALQHCERYELVNRTRNTAVLRRGAAFKLEIKLNQMVDLKHKQKLVLTFGIGPRPNVIRGTQEVLEVTGKRQFDHSPKEDWDARVDDITEDTVTVEVQVAASCPVGVWSLKAEVSQKLPSSSLPHNRPPPPPRHTLELEDVSFYILYNPWSKNDQVYLANEEHRQEYVLADVGKIWVGSYPRPRGRQWVFGQFDDAVLPACVLLLERSGLSTENRANPILVSRAISRIVNSNDDRGVVVGRWDGEYEDGTAPTGWTGSIKILEEYMRRQKPVRYGQCWVFSGVVTTVCRALGLPCRSVSNLNSAHDTNVSLTIDEYFDKDGEDYSFNPDGSNPSGLGDSIWNFHVWNDAWMARPDLPSGYGGWQAIDSTPQETSDGLYQCGPASLEAIRRGQVSLQFDVPFVLAEVNADLIRWQQDPEAKGGFKKISTHKSHIGRQLLTKVPGRLEDSTGASADRQDCTTDYKAPEGTDTERVTLYGAARHIRSARHAFRFPSIAEMDVEFELVNVDTVDVGDDYGVAIKMKNSSEAVRSVSLSLSSASEYYTGVKAHTIRRAEGTFVLQPGHEESLELPVRYSDYISKLVEHGMMKILAIANVKETTQSWIADDKFQIIKPNITVEAPKTVVLGAPILVRVHFRNPLEEMLTQASIVLDGPGLTRPKKIAVADIPAKAEFRHSLRLFSKRAGEKRSLVVTFSSKQLSDIMGSTTISVTPSE